MIALQLTNTKQFMHQLLLADTFDSFLLIEGTIVMGTTFHLDGFLHREFYSDLSPELAASLPEYSSWSALKEYCLQIIKGKQSPLSMTFTFSLTPSAIDDLIKTLQLSVSPVDVKGLYLNLQYDGQRAQCITGTSFQTFLMDKTLEQAWDQRIRSFFQEQGLDYTEL